MRAAMAPSSHLGEVELLAGDPAAAVRALRRGYDALERMGEKSFRSTLSAQLAEALYAAARYDEAEAFTATSEAAASSDDVVSQVGWRCVRARVLARRGRHAEATPLAREAVALADRTDMLVLRGDARLALAAVLELAGTDGAPSLLAEAVQLYEAKESIVAAAHARTLLERARVSTSSQI
jgi:hypothetical protein